MIYNTGTVNVVEGVKTVTGIDTEFLKYVDIGSLFKLYGETDFYTIIGVPDNTTLTLDRGYAGLTKNAQQFTINPDRTPNMGLPILQKNDPDATKTLNIALNIIDRNIGNFLDFTDVGSVSLSGEKVAYVYNDYHDSGLEVNRIVSFENSSGETTILNKVLTNTIFTGQIHLTPSGEIISYDNGTVSPDVPAKWDVIHNINKTGYGFIQSGTFGTTGSFSLSGESKFSDDDWENNDVLAVYGKTHGLGQLQSIFTGSGEIVAVSGEALTSSKFASGMFLYNYNRGNYRTLNSTSGSSPVTFSNPVSIDDWAIGDVVYTLKQRIEFETSGIPATSVNIKSGMKGNLFNDCVKESHIDWGTGLNQVSAYDIPIDIDELSATTIEGAIDEVNQNLINHTLSGEAHTATSITFVDDGLGRDLNSTNVGEALNELKLRADASFVVDGVISSGETKSSFFCSEFIGTQESFFNDEDFWVGFNSGSNKGTYIFLDTFSGETGRFILSGECPYIPQTGTSVSFYSAGTAPTREAFEEAFGEDSTAIVLRGSQVSVEHSGLFVSGETVQDFVRFISAGSPTSAESTTVTEIGSLSGETVQDFFNQIGTSLVRPVSYESYDTYVGGAWGAILFVLTCNPYTAHFDDLVPPIPTTLEGRRVKITYTRSGETHIEYGKFGAHTASDWVHGIWGNYWVLTEQGGITPTTIPNRQAEEAQLELLDHFYAPGTVLTATGPEVAEFRTPTVSGENVFVQETGVLSGETAQDFFNQIGANSLPVITTQSFNITSTTTYIGLLWNWICPNHTARIGDWVRITAPHVFSSPQITKIFNIVGDSIILDPTYLIGASEDDTSGTMEILPYGYVPSVNSAMTGFELKPKHVFEIQAPYLSGEATVWDDMIFEMTPARINPTATEPTFDYDLDCMCCSSGEVMRMSGQFKHHWKEGSTVYPHAHLRRYSVTYVTDAFTANADPVWVGTGRKFGLDYKWYNIGDPIPTEWSYIELNEIPSFLAGLSGEKHMLLVNSTGISGVGKTKSSIIKMRLSNKTSTTSGELLLDAFDIHYEIDSMGSPSEWYK